MTSLNSEAFARVTSALQQAVTELVGNIIDHLSLRSPFRDEETEFQEADYSFLMITELDCGISGTQAQFSSTHKSSIPMLCGLLISLQVLLSYLKNSWGSEPGHILRVHEGSLNPGSSLCQVDKALHTHYFLLSSVRQLTFLTLKVKLNSASFYNYWIAIIHQLRYQVRDRKLNKHLSCLQVIHNIF